MSPIFLFDLDSTITKQEILPEISKLIGKETEMRKLTEKTMLGEYPFKESFSARVKLLQDIPVSQVSKMIQNIQLNSKLIKFIQQNKDKCYVVTGNLDIWIDGLMRKIGIENHVFCSHAIVEDDKIIKIEQIVSKDKIIKNFPAAYTIAIGDGSNDKGLLNNADIGIAFGGVRPIAPVLLDVCDYAVYTEEKLYDLITNIKAYYDKK